MEPCEKSAPFAAATLVLIMVLGPPAPTCRAQEATPFPDPASVSWDRDPETLVVSYQDVWAEFADQDPTPLVRIYGDGRVLIHHPAYTPRAGQYESRLASAELESLLRSFVANGLASFEPALVRRLKISKERERWQTALAEGKPPELFLVADDSTSVFEIHLESYSSPRGATAPGMAQTSGPVHRTTRWLGLGTDAARYPEIAEIQRLRAAELELRALVDRPDLRRVAR